MEPLRPTRMIDVLVGLPLVWMILWAGLASLTIALLVLMRTRWGQSHPLRKCTVLSLFAHALLACFATTVKIVSVTAGHADDPISISFASGDNQVQQVGASNSTREMAYWDIPESAPEEPPAPLLERAESLKRWTLAKPTAATPVPTLATFSPRLSRDEQSVDAALEAVPTLMPTLTRRLVAAELKAPAAQQSKPEPVVAPAETPERSDPLAEQPLVPTRKAAPAPLLEETAALVPPTLSVAGVASEDPHESKLVPVESSIPRETSVVPPTNVAMELPAAPSPASDEQRAGTAEDLPSAFEPAPRESQATGTAATPPGEPRPFQLPTVYQDRFSHDRLESVRRHGGGPETEAAVENALRWLAANQEADGHWDANRHGAGQETKTLGHDRQHAGLQANTGMTALALLTFMGAGHTHEDGAYSENVRQGLQYLLNSQSRDGNLAGEATFFARMYCHGMAAFALAEAFAMTGDERLQPAVQSAIRYTIRAQRKNTGGWRYQPGDFGDISQTGWQLMALKSAELCGETIPGQTRGDLQRFLTSVSSGRFGGLASYRPQHQVSRSMTAEAMYCRQLIGDPISPQAAQETATYLLDELPGRGEMNLYYWYYGTLCLYYHQGDAWDRWNAALKESLLKTQKTDGDEAGSWEAQCIWGGYGGRVYCTSMAALNLEVYYRYLPLHVEQARSRQLIR